MIIIITIKYYNNNKSNKQQNNHNKNNNNNNNDGGQKLKSEVSLPSDPKTNIILHITLLYSNREMLHLITV